MLEQLIAITRNTFFESIRQPIVLVVLVVATILLILSNPLSAFTMEDDQRMLIDIGMATIFLAGALLAAFVATGVLTREIENKTALTVISKPVARPIFVIGKYLGVAGALLLCSFFMCLVFLLVELHTVLQTVREEVHLPVIIFGIGAAVIGVVTAVWCNYFYGKVFTSTVVVVTTPLVLLAYLASLKFDKNFQVQPFLTDFKGQIVLAQCCLIVAILVLTAIAIALSARLGQVLTLVATLAFFLLGMMSDWLLGRPIQNLKDTWLQRAVEQGLTTETAVQSGIILDKTGEQVDVINNVVEATVPLASLAENAESLWYFLLRVGQSIIPNFQVLWLSDALTQGNRIPTAHVITTMVYGVCYIIVALAFGVLLFQRREVGGTV